MNATTSSLLDPVTQGLTEAADGFKKMMIAIAVFSFIVTVAIVVISIKK